MEGKNISRYTATDIGVNTMLNLYKFLGDDSYEERKIANTRKKDFEVDTCYTLDTDYPETAIISKFYNQNKGIVVSQYENGEEAKEGHKKWVRFMKTKPVKLFDIFTNEEYTRSN